jgi:hypothetical protein
MEQLTTARNDNGLSLVHVQETFTEAEIIDDLPFEPDVSTSKPFIQANTVEASFDEVRNKHIIPVFIKDNEPVISHVDFIESTSQMVSEIYHGEHILKPNIRVSHPIKGRVPEAKNKPANQLLEHEKTLYFERMAFVIEIPSIYDTINGNTLSLCVGGVKAYNLDNLHNKKGADEHFKIFAGFQNSVCTNLCVWSDGFINDLKVQSLGQLKACIRTLLQNYNAQVHLEQMKLLTGHSLTEQQFAKLVGRCRMYSYLPTAIKKNIQPLLLTDTQLGMMCRDYYRSNSFCKDSDGNINLWKVYNLFTGANKSSYIDNFIDRSVNAYEFVEQIRFALQECSTNWFLR